ncbi:MAG: hypothetical protein D3910_03835 [Candidatus Electrothrix sp. ATG2]|nr:hypothetical protein [Candidatus Electrothrix sp. ATG2]
MDPQVFAIFLIISCVASLIYGLLPMLLMIELYHWIIKRNYVQNPVVSGTVLGFSWGVVSIFILIQLMKMSGEGGEGNLVGVPIFVMFLFFAFIVLGFIIGSCYQAKNRTIFIKKNGKNKS